MSKPLALTLALTFVGCATVFNFVASTMRVEADKAMKEAAGPKVANTTAPSTSSVAVDGHLIDLKSTPQGN